MNTGQPQAVSVTLRRDGLRQPWGLRIVGGVDLGTPLVITRAQVGTPSEGELRRGDIIKKIGAYDARDLRHEDVQTLFKNAGNNISLVVQREQTSGGAPSSIQGTLLRSHTQPLPTVAPYVPQQPKPPVAGGVATPFAMAGQPERSSTPSFIIRPQTPVAAPRRNELPVVFPPPLPSALSGGRPQQHVRFDDGPTADVLEEDINTQPYRTTPLVLPGAKVKKDAQQTESYLRHHPNPMFRAPPAHYDPTVEVLMKQKVADTVLQRVVGDETASKQVVHKQFNSPIGLYSDQNIADTIHSQTGATPARSSTLDRRNQVPVSMKKTYLYDPAKSETFKALQESELGDNTIHEVTVPVQTRVFTPNRVPPAKKPVQPYQPVVHQTTFANSLGNYEEKIQQSGSFKRLMNHVFGESDY